MKKTHIISTLILLCVAMFFGAIISMNTAKVNATTDFAVVDGAQIRVMTESKDGVDNYGIRFTANVGQVVDGAEYRMMIVPETYIQAYNTAKKEESNISNIAQWLLDKKANYPDMPLAITGVLNPNTDGEIIGSIVTLRYNNLNTKFAGIAYYTANEQIFAAAVAQDGLRSIVDVAENVLADGIYDDDTEEENVIIKANIEKFVRLAINQKAGKTAEDETAISLNKNVEKLKVAGGLQLTYEPAIAVDAAQWSSSNEKVATVKNGMVTAVGEGFATITVSIAGVMATCDIVVTPDNINVLSTIKTNIDKIEVLDGVEEKTAVAYSINQTSTDGLTDYTFDKTASYTLNAEFALKDTQMSVEIPITVADFENVDFAAEQSTWNFLTVENAKTELNVGTFEGKNGVSLVGNALLDAEIVNAAREAGYWTLTLDVFVPLSTEDSGYFAMVGYMAGGNTHNIITTAAYTRTNLNISNVKVTAANTGVWRTLYLDVTRFYDDEFIMMMRESVSEIYVSNMKFHWVPKFTSSDTQISSADITTYGKYIFIPTFAGAMSGAEVGYGVTTQSWGNSGLSLLRTVSSTNYLVENTWTVLRGYFTLAYSFGKTKVDIPVHSFANSIAMGAYAPWYSTNPWYKMWDIGWGSKGWNVVVVEFGNAMIGKTPAGESLTPYDLSIQDRLDYVFAINCYYANDYINVRTFKFI